MNDMETRVSPSGKWMSRRLTWFPAYVWMDSQGEAEALFPLLTAELVNFTGLWNTDLAALTGSDK